MKKKVKQTKPAKHAPVKKRHKKQPVQTPEQIEEERIKDFLDIYLPGHVTLFNDCIQQDNKFRSFWVIKSYPSTTTEEAILSDLGQMPGVTLHIIGEEMNSAEEGRLIQAATRRTRAIVNSNNDAQMNISAQEDSNDIDALIRQLHRNKERLVKTTVFIECAADDVDQLQALQMEVSNILLPNAISVDYLINRQAQGFLSTMPGGKDQFKGEFNRAIPMASLANLYPFSYTGKSDPHGFFVGKDANGSYIITDIDRRGTTVTNSNVAVLGNSGMGKSYLLKGLTCNWAEEGKNIIILDPEGEYPDLVKNLGGTYLDLMSGDYMINVLEPKTFTRADDDESINAEDDDVTKTYNTKGALSQHISFLRDFFHIYKQDLSGTNLDILEIILSDMYAHFGIDNSTDLTKIPKNLYPTMKDLWQYAYNIYTHYDPAKYMYTREDLRVVLLAIQSICQGSQARYFDGHTNIQNAHIIGFGLKGIMEADESLKNAMLFNVLSYMSDRLLNEGDTVAILDEFYLFLGSSVSVTYVRNCMKRVRKFNSSVCIASQNIDDFLNPRIASMTKPLLAIPAHKFLFYPGQVNVEEFANLLQLEPNEYQIISTPHRGLCLYMCGSERYSLMVTFPDWKTKLFGNGGGN